MASSTEIQRSMSKKKQKKERSFKPPLSVLGMKLRLRATSRSHVDMTVVIAPTSSLAQLERSSICSVELRQAAKWLKNEERQKREKFSREMKQHQYQERDGHTSANRETKAGNESQGRS